MGRERTQLDNRHNGMVAAHEDGSELIQVARIRTDGGTQMRAEIDEAVVREYADLMKGGHKFPPIHVYYDGTNYWLADGFHRLLAWELFHQLKRDPVEKIACIVHGGDRREAILHAVGANAEHGLRRTNADKRRAVQTLLRDKEWQTWSAREIARKCGVSHQLVNNLRPARHTGNDCQHEERVFVHPKTGEPTTMNTGNIGKRRDPAPVRQPHPAPPPDPAPPVYTQPRVPEPSFDALHQRRDDTVKALEQDVEWFELTIERLDAWADKTGRQDILLALRREARRAIDVSIRQLAAQRGEEMEPTS